MRKTRPEDFDPDYKERAATRPEPEDVNLEGVVAIKPRSAAAPTLEEPNDNIMVSRHHDTTESWFHETLESIRQAVKEVGKEAATHRFTVAEKRAIGKIVFTYQQEGIKTSENEIVRIAINYLLKDYEANGEDGILAQVLEKLNS